MQYLLLNNLENTCRFIPASENLSDASNRRWGNK
nr:MAG TPA: hypothetical protein [Caudoviricetes sp.]